MVNDILFAFWFFIPAGVANMVPVFAARLPVLARWNAPMDFGKTFRGKRIFGQHKTWRGLIAGAVMATITLWVQQYLVREYGWFAGAAGQAGYSTLPTLVLGSLFAIGALGGDAIKSFFKRQKGVAPGRSWFPFDQVDFIVGAGLATAPFVVLSSMQYVWVTLLLVLGTMGASALAYLAGLKEHPI